MTISRLLSFLAGGLNSSGIVGITKGGTGATSYSEAQENLYLGTPNNVTFSSVSDASGDVRNMPITNKTASYSPVVADNGKVISITTGGISILSNSFFPAQGFTVYNNSSSNQIITQGSGVSLLQSGTTNTGNRTLGPYGLATILCLQGLNLIYSMIMNGDSNVVIIPQPISTLGSLRVYLNKTRVTNFFLQDDPFDPGVSTWVIFGGLLPKGTLAEMALPSGNTFVISGSGLS